MSDFGKIVCLDMSNILDAERNSGWKDAGWSWKVTIIPSLHLYTIIPKHKSSTFVSNDKTIIYLVHQCLLQSFIAILLYYRTPLNFDDILLETVCIGFSTKSHSAKSSALKILAMKSLVTKPHNYTFIVQCRTVEETRFTLS